MKEVSELTDRERRIELALIEHCTPYPDELQKAGYTRDECRACFQRMIYAGCIKLAGFGNN